MVMLLMVFDKSRKEFSFEIILLIKFIDSLHSNLSFGLGDILIKFNSTKSDKNSVCGNLLSKI